MINVEKPGKPDAPEITSATLSTISLAYKPPADDGGAEITNYVIEYREEGLMKWSRANTETVNKTSYSVTGLKKNSVYEFRVAAENKAGVGPPSEPSSPTAAKEVLSKTTITCDSSTSSSHCTLLYSLILCCAPKVCSFIYSKV